MTDKNAMRRKTFGPTTISPYLDGYRVDFGGVKGWQIFDTYEDMQETMSEWARNELSRLAKEVEGIAKMQRFLN